MTLDIDDFGSRILEPAMSVLAANIESDAMSMYKDVYNHVTEVGATITSRDVMRASKVLTDNLAPYDSR